jgi:site-specific DNA-methyltransferase (adenine-specific)
LNIENQLSPAACASRGRWGGWDRRGGEEMLELNRLYNMDCMEGMKQFPDKYFELAIVDPPYGIARFGNRVELSNRIYKETKINKWDIKPTQEYFDELFRVSQKQIIWGANNFTLPETEYFIVWDKWQTVDNFASAEYAWTNIKMPAKVFRYAIHKEMAERKGEGGKIHPTQKPVKLYEWLLANYAKPGDKILDTHVGSASSLIACYNMGFEYIGFEIDKDYYEAAQERMRIHMQQLTIF